MDDATRSEVDVWLAKAQRDLDSAKRLLAGNPPYRDTAADHCQRASEKSIKAFLTAAAIAFPKTHDLTTLVSLAIDIDGDIAKWEEAAVILTPFATLYRYPDAFPEPGDDDLRDATMLTGQLLEDIAGKLSSAPPAGTA